MTETRYSALLKEADESLEYWTEAAILDFTEELARVMEKQRVSRAELARRIGHSQAYVTKVLRGNVNFTLATMTKLAKALDAVVRVHLAPTGVSVVWVDRGVATDSLTVELPQNASVRFLPGSQVHTNLISVAA